jgi:serine/threonine protein kinase
MEKVIELGISMATTLSYLHTELKMIHCDCLSNNWMYNEETEQPVICDFGSAVVLGTEKTTKVMNFMRGG